METACYNFVLGYLGETSTAVRPDLFPCGPINDTAHAVPCCLSQDTCLSNGLCLSAHSGPGKSGSPGESFQAPAPEKLVSYFSIPTSGYTQSIPISTPSPTPSLPKNLTNHTCPPPEIRLTAGASAGIGVGAGLATVLVGAVTLFLISTRYRRSARSVSGSDGVYTKSERAKSQQEQVGIGPVASMETPTDHGFPQELRSDVNPRGELQA